jgi:hypothetical protein
MANVNNPHGLQLVGYTENGGCPVIREFKKLVGYGTAIFINDAVNRVATGAIEASATPGTTLYSGVALTYSPASTAGNVLVCTSPTAIYESQGNGAIAEADMGLNANLLLTAGGGGGGLQSKHQINATGMDVTATLDVHLLELYGVPENDWGAYARVTLMFNKHRMAPAAVGV